MEGHVPSESPDRGGVDELIGSTTERVQSVLEAAERAAEGIIKDAEAEAERQIAESKARAERLVAERSRLATQLSDELLEQAATIREQSEHLIAALQRAIRAVEHELGAAPRAVGGATESEAAAEGAAPERSEGAGVGRNEVSARGGGLTAVPPPESPGPAFDPSATGARGETGSYDPAKAARLLATQMAVAGSSREEIETRLREEFGIDDPGGILDAVGGRGRGEPDGRSP
jgi:hypothetical protein